MRFTLRQLEYFIAAGETGSITHASERINISQPSISAAISNLEMELGVQLFIRRHAQGLSLTPAGQRLMAEAKAVIEQAEGLYAVAGDISELVRGPLSIGSLVTFAPMVMPELCQGFVQRYKETRLTQFVGHQEELFEGLRRAEIDVAITYDLELPDDIAFEALADLPAHALVHPEHALAGRKAVALAALAGDPFILLDLPLSREYFMSIFLREGLHPKIVMRSAHQEVVRALVANGYGYTLANVRPKTDICLDGKKVVALELKGDFRPMVLGLATIKQLGRSRLRDVFLQFCRDAFEMTGVPGMALPKT